MAVRLFSNWCLGTSDDSSQSRAGITTPNAHDLTTVEKRFNIRQAPLVYLAVNLAQSADVGSNVPNGFTVFFGRFDVVVKSGEFVVCLGFRLIAEGSTSC